MLEFNLQGAQPDQMKPLARILMSPQQTKATLILPQRFVNIYEKTFSPIGMPAELERQLKGGEDDGNTSS